MVRELISSAWVWGMVGMALMALELVIPGVYLLFVGAAALITAALFLVLPGLPLWIAACIFVGLTVAGILWGRSLYKMRGGEAAQALNDRSSLLIDTTAIVATITSPGLGSVKVGDTTWRAKWSGEVELGQAVTIKSVESATLIVETTA